jgi:STE24 endopeptidase
MSEMTATRMGRLGRAATALVLAVAWLAVAAWLWRTTVPDLHLDGFDQRRFFGARTLARAHDYADGRRVIWILSTIATLVALAVLVRVVPRRASALGLGRIGSAIVIGMLVLVTLWFVSLPFGFASLWWQHHYGLGPFDVLAWLVAQRYALAASAVFAMLAIVVVVGFAGRFGRRWWLLAAPLFVGLAVLFAFLGGWLASADTKPVRDAKLRASVTRLEAKVGVSGTPVHVQDVSDWTDQANAFAAGFGPSTNVVLWNTLLDGRFSHAEVSAVVAHELGHVKRRHVPKALAWFALFMLPGLYLVEALTRRRGGIENPVNLPYALLVLTVVGLAFAPFQNLVTRRYEAEADWIALRATNDPAAVERLFERFGRTSLQEPNPPLLEYIWLENHPTLMQRIAMAERFRERRGSG